MQQPNLLLEGKYEILGKIREGGMGTIYRVRHRLLDEIRVVKVMRPHVVADADLKRRFLEEARTAIRLRHPNICAIHDYAADEQGTAYLVMEFIDGANLSDLLKTRGPLGVPLTVEIGHQALLALGYLHRKGVIHRDVAPDNLMLTHDEEGRPVVKLIDLGIAKAVNRDMDITATGVFLGKPKYASPEQFISLPGGEKLDGRSDLYGLGVVLYELLTGIRPYKGDSPVELLRAQHLNRLIPFEESDPQGRVPFDLRAVILRALRKKRDDRFGTAEEFDRELAGSLDRYSSPQDLKVTTAILTTRAMQPAVSDNVTPSAQDRLDRHFGAQATPSPSAPLLAIVPPEPLENPAFHTVRLPLASSKAESRQAAEKVPGQEPAVDPTQVNVPLAALAAEISSETTGEKIEARKPDSAHRAEAAAAPAQGATPPPSATADPAAVPVPSAWIRTPPPRRTMSLLAVGIAASVALLLWHPWGGRPPEKRAAAAPPPPAQLSSEATVAVAPPPEPISASPAIAEAQAPNPSAPPLSENGARELAEVASAAAAQARKDADEVRGADFAPTTYRRAVAKQKTATNLAAQGAEAEAKQLFDEASLLFGRAAAAGREGIHPTMPAQLSVAKDRVEKAQPPSSAAPASEPQIDPAAAAEARRRIVRVVGDYAWARRTRDEKLFAQVFPSDMASFKRDLKMFERQDVRLDIRSIDFEGGRAVVSANEIVIGTPRAGDEARNESVILLQLVQQGGRWVIVNRR